MVSDPMNFDQFTWKQFRAQIRSFKSTTTQFKEFLLDRGLFKTEPAQNNNQTDQELVSFFPIKTDFLYL